MPVSSSSSSANLGFPGQYSTPPPLRSIVVRKAPDPLPATEELEQAEAELRILKRRSLDTARRVGEDLRALDDSVRRIRERDRVKQRNVDRIKKERGSTPAFKDDERSTPAYSPPLDKRTRLPSVSSTTSSTPYSARPPLDPHKSFDGHKKKKRKRDPAESDGEPDAQRQRKGSPHPAPSISSHTSFSHPPKAPKLSTIASTSKQVNGVTNEWALPPSAPLVPKRPAPIPPPISGPSSVTEVMTDFSIMEVPKTQTSVAAVYEYARPWHRPVKEEDVGLLEFVPEDTDAFIVPPLGKHYSQVWLDEDTLLYGGPLPGTAAVNPIAGPSTRPIIAGRDRGKWEPATLADEDLLGEEKGHGPLTERLVSALLPTPDQVVWKGVKAAEEAMEGRSAGGANAAAARDSMTIGNLENRVRDSMRFLGLMHEDVDPSRFEPLDDPISSALRQCQRLLRPLSATNKARKRRLLEIARDRLGYQEYLEARDALDKNIALKYGKLRREDLPRAKPEESSSARKDKKRKSRPGSAALAAAAHVPAVLPKHEAAHGLPRDDELQLGVPEDLMMLTETRRKWVDQIGGVFNNLQEKHPGRIWGFPPTSIYEGIEEEVAEEVARAPKWYTVQRPQDPEPEPAEDTQMADDTASAPQAHTEELEEDWLEQEMDMEEVAPMDVG